jgi:hypothetical protein
MKNDMNDELSNGTPKMLIPSNGVLNWDKVLKSSDMAKGDHATQFLKLDIKIYRTKSI